MHPNVRAFVQWASMWSPEHGYALDVGGRNINGSVHGVWPNMQWTILDLHGDPDNYLDRVIEADARSWEPDREYNLVISTELLEHVNGWRDCVNTMVNALAPGGMLIITCAGPGRRPHGMSGEFELPPGEHYENINGISLSTFLESRVMLSDAQVYNQGDDVRAIAWRTE